MTALSAVPEWRRPLRRMLVAALAAAAAGTFLGGCGSSDTPERDDQRVAFISDRGGAVDLFVMNADGTGERRLTQDDVVGYLSDYALWSAPPTWSPDGERIAYENDSGDIPAVHVVKADGTGKRILVRAAGFPAWSPEGDVIAFTRERGKKADIWAVSPDGTDARILVRNAWLGAWSPDGRNLVFVRRKGDDTDLYVARLSDGVERRLTTSAAPDLLPAWAPAERIAFVRYIENEEIFVIEPDGTNERRLTQDLARDTSPAWSPDGSRIAFTNDLTFTKEWLKGEEIFLVAADGSGRTRLTHNEVRDVAPAWEPVQR